MNKNYTDEQLKNIEKTKKYSRITGTVLAFLVGLVGLTVFSSNILIGIIGGAIVAGVINFLIRKNDK